MSDLHSNMKRLVHQLFPHVIRQPGDFGVEMEIEGINLPKSCQGWNAHVDNSLRGKNGRQLNSNEDVEDTPREYTTKGAVGYGPLWTALTCLCLELKRAKTEVVLSHRCSTHIHVNQQNGTLRDCFGFLLFFVAVEPVLLRLCGNARNGNLFCVPTSEAGDIPTTTQLCVTRVIDGQFHYWPSEESGHQRGKYGAINIDQLPRFGSWEVRCFPASIDPDEIYKWVGWLNNIKTQSRAWGRADYSDFFDYAASHAQAFLNTIFPNENLWLACGPQNVNDLVSAGVENSYEIYRSLLPVFQFDEKKVKKQKGKSRTLASDAVSEMQQIPFDTNHSIDWDEAA